MAVMRGEVVSAGPIKTPTLDVIAFECGNQDLHHLLDRQDWFMRNLVVCNLKKDVAFSVKPNTIMVTIKEGYADDVVLAVSPEKSGLLIDFMESYFTDDGIIVRNFKSVIYWIARRAEQEHIIQLKKDSFSYQTRQTALEIHWLRERLNTCFWLEMHEESVSTRAASPLEEP
jgi:hypothetical protein